MAEIPENKLTNEDIAEWYRLKQEMARLRPKEMNLRKKIFKAKFPDPKEGTNTAELDDGTGFQLKATHVIDRKVDLGAFQSIAPKLRDMGIDPDSLVDWEPKLKTKPYRALDEESRNVFEQALVIKPGSPQLDVKLPASRKG